MTLPLDGRRILFVGGKGGVGKSTTAASLAVGMAEAGERVLLVSTDPAHSLADLFGVPIGDGPKTLLPNLEAVEIDPEKEVDRYLGRVARTMRRFVQPEMYPEIGRQMELTRQSPGAEEAALLDRVTKLMDDGLESHDRVIFDTAPTGHTLRLLTLPEVMAAWTDGLIRSREKADALGKAIDRLGRGRARNTTDVEGGAAQGEAAGAAAETAASQEAGSSARRRREAPGDELAWFDDPDEAPEDERAREIREVLMERRRRFTRARRLLLDADTTAFLLVLIPEKLPILESEKALAVLRKHDVPVAGVVVNRVLPDLPLGDFLESRRDQEGEYLARIDRSFTGVPRVDVPLLARDVHGVESLREVYRHLGGG